MLVVATVQPGAGHLLPVVPLLQALEVAGHAVVVAASASLRPLVERFGLRAEPVGPDWSWSEPHGLLGRAAATGPQEYRAALTDAIDVARFAVLPDLTSLLDELRPQLVVHEQYEPSGALAAELSGIACLCLGHGYSPYLGSPTGPAHRAHPARSALGLPAVPGDTWTYAYADSYPPSLHPFPAVASARRWPLRPLVPVPATGDRDASDPASAWPAGPGRRVLVTFGSAAGPRSGQLPLVEEAVRTAGAVPLVLGAPARPGRPAAFAALAPLLEQADLVVSHGGSGTTVAALAAGRPVLVLPGQHEQHYLGFRISGAGAGAALPDGDVTPSAVRALVEELLADPAYAANARRLAAEIAAMPGPAHTVARLEELVGRTPAAAGGGTSRAAAR